MASTIFRLKINRLNSFFRFFEQNDVRIRHAYRQMPNALHLRLTSPFLIFMKKHFFVALAIGISALLAQTPAHSAQSKAVTQSNQIKLIGTDSNGANFDLKNYAGKTVLVSFYGAACTVCERDLKLMREFYRDNAAKKFVLVGVNIDKTKSDFETYAKIVALSTPKNQQFPLLWKGNLNSLDGFGNVSTGPVHFVINSKGELILRRDGTFKGEDWDNLWESLAQ